MCVYVIVGILVVDDVFDYMVIRCHTMSPKKKNYRILLLIITIVAIGLPACITRFTCFSLTTVELIVIFCSSRSPT